MLNGEQIYLRPLVVDDVKEDYVAWMNDYEIVKYTESKSLTNTQESIRKYVLNANNADTFTFAIVARDGALHIGNIKLHVNWVHRYGDIGLIIGRKDYHGRGMATEAIRLITDYAFSVFNLRKVWCGVYAPNIGSIRAFQKVGFEIHAKFPRHCFFEGDYVDCVYLQKFNEAEERK